MSAVARLTRKGILTLISANAAMRSRGGGGGEELSFALTLTGMRKTILGRNDTLIKFFYMVFSNSAYIIEKFYK